MVCLLSHSHRFSIKNSASQWVTPGWTVLTERATSTRRSPVIPRFTSCLRMSSTTGKGEKEKCVEKVFFFFVSTTILQVFPPSLPSEAIQDDKISWLPA